MTLFAPPAPDATSRRHSWFTQALVVVLVAAPGLANTGLSETAYSSVLAAVLFVPAILAVVVRQRYPRTAVICVVALAVGAMAVDGALMAHVVAVLVCVYTVARRTDRLTSVVVVVVSACVLTTGILTLLESPWRDVRVVFQTTAFLFAAAAAGDATRSRRAVIDAITERARRAEETKESEALRRVAEERVRIARDLHDVLAHQIAVINLHSNVAAQALRARPDDAEKSLATIREAARNVLGEMGSLLNVLRAGDAQPTLASGSVAPVAGLSELTPMIAGFENDGLRVDLRQDGQQRQLPGEVDIVAYRVIQEALTNAHKHGADRSALLYLNHGPEVLEIIVTNTINGPPTGAGGHGLIGARERVASVRGTLEVGTGPGPVHRFTAQLPITAARDISRTVATPDPVAAPAPAVAPAVAPAAATVPASISSKATP